VHAESAVVRQGFWPGGEELGKPRGGGEGQGGHCYCKLIRIFVDAEMCNKRRNSNYEIVY